MRSTFLGSSVTSLKPAGFRDLVPAGRITLKLGRASATVSSVWSTRCNSYPSSPTSGQHGQNLQASYAGCPDSCSADVLLGVGCLPGGLRAAVLAHRVGCRVTPIRPDFFEHSGVRDLNGLPPRWSPPLCAIRQGARALPLGKMVLTDHRFGLDAGE